ncbi:hypothetical protein IQ266_04210 [filamentous cyanobacterium LEGE 11480]|uniref:Uncharacterized protein n=1 Tax=Romeriopsis navalis LEGE 11480 TaxID=2777977 RepID=A0A928Z153_9CYAN|nr:hypothetical protein [Romeriopsis navalis]MBE9028966.1 hypothetical protein [Romeriopsis navalis LEGE 11480]
MMINLGRDFSLIVWIITALGSSVATGTVVGILASTPMQTYRLMVWIFLGSAMTWLLSAFVGGAVIRFVLETLLAQEYWQFGLLVGLLLVFSGFMLGRLGRNHRAMRWSLAGALAAWLTGAIGSIIAYDQLGSSSTGLPAGFWGSLMLSMVISTILGAFGGGMIFRHRQMWRDLSSTPPPASRLKTKQR